MLYSLDCKEGHMKKLMRLYVCMYVCVFATGMKASKSELTSEQNIRSWVFWGGELEYDVESDSEGPGWSRRGVVHFRGKKTSKSENPPKYILKGFRSGERESEVDSSGECWEGPERSWWVIACQENVFLHV